MDIDMPEMSGIDTVLVSKAKFPETRFIMLTVYDDDDKLFQAIRAGANGYLLKDERIPTIVKHIESLYLVGGAPMSPVIAQKTLTLLMQADFRARKEENFQLSKREKEVLVMMINGHNYKEIAERLFISKNTVRKHISNIL